MEQSKRDSDASKKEMWESVGRFRTSLLYWWHGIVAVCRSLTDTNVYEIDCIYRQHENPFSSFQFGFGPGKSPYKETAENQDDRIDQVFCDEGNRADGSGNPENKQDIENVGTDDVSDRHVKLVLSCGDNRGYKFRKAGTAGNDGKADQCLTETQSFGNGDGSVHDEISAELDGDTAPDNIYETFPDRKNVIGFASFCPGLDGGNDHPYDICHKKEQKQDAVHMSHCHTEISEQNEQDGTDDREGKFFLQSICLYDKGHEQGTDTTDDHQIKNIGTHNIADSKGVVVGKGRGNADSAFRKTGSHGDNGHADDDGGHPETFCHGRAAVYKEIRTFDQEDKADDQ